MRRLLAGVIVCGLIASGIQCLGQHVFKGPFRAEAMAFYIVHQKGPLKVTLSAIADKGRKGKIVCRFFDAKEQLKKWEYGKVSSGKKLIYELDYGKNAPAGIYQVRYSGKNINVSLTTAPQESFGIMPLRCMLKCTSANQFSNAFFYILPNADYFSVRGYGTKGKVFNAEGKEIASIKSRSAKIDVKGKGGQIWRISLKMRPRDYYRFGFSGMPLILCPDKKTAEAIHGSLEKTEDGKYFPHKFQVGMYNWMKGLKQKDLELKPFDFQKYEKQILEDKKSYVLFGKWGLLKHLPYVIKKQNINPASKDFGKIVTSFAQGAMPAAYALDKSYNPYYMNEVLEKRILLAAFNRLLKLTENDSFSLSDVNYSGGDALSFTSLAQAYYFAGDKIKDKKLHKLWSSGLRRVPDRFSMYRVSCENQSSHWPVIYWYTMTGSGEKGYGALADDYIKGLSLPENNSFMKTGYQQEAYGPDATYQGLGACYQAAYYRMTGDINAKTGLQIIYDLFNHTVAPEPDGQVFGASNFSHRTAGGWTSPQYDAGRALMKGILPGAAVWKKKSNVTKKAQVKAVINNPLTDSFYKGRTQVCGYATSAFSPFFSEFLFPSKTISGAQLPVMKSDNFVKNFNNEFVAVRRPAYYTVFYIGKTAARWTRKLAKRKPENKKDVYKWNQVQGMSVFWTPQYGNCILSMNWNGSTPQMVRADLKDGKCSFPDYWTLKSNFDQKKMTLSIRNQLFDLPVNVDRKVFFRENCIEQDIVLSFSKDVSVDALYEQIPFLKNKKDLKVLFKDGGKWTAEPGIVNAVKFLDAVGNGFEISFTKPYKCVFGKDSQIKAWGGKQIMGSLRIELGNEFKAGQSIFLKYKLIPIRK